MDVPYRPVTNDLKLILFTKDLKRRNLHRKNDETRKAPPDITSIYQRKAIRKMPAQHNHEAEHTKEAKP
jgi:hypothetical protein